MDRGDRQALRNETLWSRLLLAILAVVVAYLFVRASLLRIEVFDAYQYLSNARRILGTAYVFYHPDRPPVLSLVMAPAVFVATLLPDHDILLLLLPHLTSALLSSLSLLAVFVFLRAEFNVRLALLGTTLFCLNRLFMKFGALVMGDVLAGGLVALTLWQYRRAARGLGLWSGLLLAISYATVASTKYLVVLLGPALFAAETVGYVRDRARGLRRLLRLGLSLGFGGVLIVVMHYAVFARVYHDAPLDRFFRAIGFDVTSYILRPEVQPTSWLTYPLMSLVALSVPFVLFALLGVLLTLREREDRDLPALLFVLVFGGFIVFAVENKEARYLLALVPCAIYFVLRLFERLPGWLHQAVPSPLFRRLGASLPGLLLAVSLYNAGHQAWCDSDPIFFADVQRTVVATARATRQAGGRLLWVGGIHSFFPRRTVEIPRDFAFNSMHFQSFAATYLASEPVYRPPVPKGAKLPMPVMLADFTRDADAIIQVDPGPRFDFDADTDFYSVQVWRTQRVVLKLRGEEFVDDAGQAFLRRVDRDAMTRLEVVAPIAPSYALVRTEARGGLQNLGIWNPRLGDNLPVAEGVAGRVRSVVLLRLEIKEIDRQAGVSDSGWVPTS